VYKGLWWGILRGKKPLGRPRHRWEDNIKMDLLEVGAWTAFDLAQDRDNWRALLTAIMNLRAPYNARNCLTI
jgi:hypothetical protein